MMENSSFKPTKALEFDVMKSILDDFSKLTCFIELFTEVKFIWHNQINEKLFQLIELHFFVSKHQGEFSTTDFYENIYKIASSEIPKFNPDLYISAYQKNFNFFTTVLNYYHFLTLPKKEKIVEMKYYMLEID